MQKGSVLPFVILLALVIVGIALVYRYFFNEPSSIGSTKIVSQVNSDKKEKTKIYKNNNLNFEFKYDQDLVVKEDSEEEFNQRATGSASKSVNGNFRKNFKSYVEYEPGKLLGAVVVLDKESNFDTNPFSVWIFDNQDNETIDSWFAKYWYYPFVWGVFDLTSKGHIIPDSEAVISDQTAKYKIIPYQPGKPKFVYISKDQKMYLFRVIGKTGEQILATFKFSK